MQYARHRKLTKLQQLLQVERAQSPLAMAIKYTLKQWDELLLYTEHARMEIDNNAIRPVAVGRKNYLFAGSEESAQIIAQISTPSSPSAKSTMSTRDSGSPMPSPACGPPSPPGKRNSSPTNGILTATPTPNSTTTTSSIRQTQPKTARPKQH